MKLTIIGASGSFPGPGSPASCYLLTAEGVAEDGVTPRTWRILLDLGNGALGTLQALADATAVDAVFAGKTRRFNRRFEQMCSHYLIEPVACTPASGWEKGQVEKNVQDARPRLWQPIPNFPDLAALNASVIAGVMKASNPDVNMVSAPIIAKERGIQVSTTSQEKSGTFDAYIKVTMVTETRERSIAGTVFSDGKPRFIQVKGINIDAEVGEHMLYTTNNDVPGIIGALGTTLGQHGVNIANFTLGRSSVGKDAIAILYLDEPLDGPTLDALRDTGLFKQVRPLEFAAA